MGTFPCRSHQDEFGELFLLCSLAERPKQTSQAAGFPFIEDFKLEGCFERNWVRNILDLEYTRFITLFLVKWVFVHICFFAWKLKSYLNLYLSSSGVFEGTIQDCSYISISKCQIRMNNLVLSLLNILNSRSLCCMLNHSRVDVENYVKIAP